MKMVELYHDKFTYIIVMSGFVKFNDVGWALKNFVLKNCHWTLQIFEEMANNNEFSSSKEKV